MLHQSHRKSAQKAFKWIALMAVGMLLLFALPTGAWTHKIERYLPLHTLLEMVSVVVALLVFVSGWNAYSRSLPRHAVILACAFLGVALLDFSHALSYVGMPDFVTPSSPQKAINFWLAARLLAASALLMVAVITARPLANANARYIWLVSVLVAVGLVHWLLLWHPDSIPRTFDPATGLSTVKIGTEYLVMGLNFAAAWVLLVSMRRPLPFNAAALLGAVCAMAMSEAFFTLYTSVNDFYNLMGHVYKVVSYLFLYRAVFIEVIEEPYRELAAVRDQLRATLNAVPDEMLELDLDGTYHAVHSSHPESLVRPAEELVGRTVHEVLPSVQAKLVTSAMQDALVHGTAAGVQLVLDLAHGQRWFELSVSRKGVPAGADTRFIVLSRDITERKLAEAAICKQEAATQASRAKNEFLSRVSHELRTPLNAVIGFSQLLLHGGASRMESGQRVYVEHILSAGRHLLEMINDIMDLTRLESSPASVKMVPVKLCDLVESCLPMILPQAQARGITVVAQAALSEHSHIMGDERRLKQVLINVLSNAVKYNEVGGLVTIRCEHRQTHPGELALIITDTGRGLTELQIKGLFEPFNRLGADQAGIDGTGLGLVISRRLIELMGGSIAVESTYGSGTAVTLCLPKSNIEVHAQPDSSHLKPLSGDMARREARVATVLCVEDNPLNLALLEAIFALRPRINLLIAADGARGLELIRKRPAVPS